MAREVYEVHITRIQRVDALLHEAERWAENPQMERLLSEAIVIIRGIVYSLTDDPTKPLEDDHSRKTLERQADAVGGTP